MSLHFPLHPLTFLDKLPSFPTQRRCWVANGGEVSYALAWETQRSLVDQRLANPGLEDILLLMEHPPVYTLGTGANPDYLKFDPATSNEPVYYIERGGEVTYHCPGQLVGYPILNLRHYQQDLHWYLRQLEEVILRVLATYHLPGYRSPGLTGVWLEGRKVAAIGIKVKRWITMHGFALNICPDLAGFAKIVPCGIADKPVGSLAEFISDLDPQQVRYEVLRAFCEVFEVRVVPVEDAGELGQPLGDCPYH